jgi:hypothetical protein
MKLLEALLYMLLVTAMASIANAQAVSIDIGDGVLDDNGETNPNGLQIEADSWVSITVGDGERIVTVSNMTFTLNPGGAEKVGKWLDYDCIIDVGDPSRYTGAVHWKIEGLVPGGAYNLVFYTAIVAQPGKFTIDGIGTATPDADGDGNFTNAIASADGILEGTWDVWTPDVWSTFTALQFVQVVKPVEPAPTGFTLIVR